MAARSTSMRSLAVLDPAPPGRGNRAASSPVASVQLDNEAKALTPPAKKAVKAPTKKAVKAPIKNAVKVPAKKAVKR
jgi:hypothetical protein